jgi:hypothetical protein
MKSPDDKKFEDFLRLNKPLAPSAPRGESKVIWARIVSEPFFKRQGRLGLWGAGTVTAALIFLALSNGVFRSRTDTIEYTDLETVEEFWQLEYSEGEDISEVADLVSLAD